MNEQKKIAVFTAISKGYDSLIEPKVISSDCDYICFTDTKKMNSDTWEIRGFPKSNLDRVRKCRQMKVLPHKFLEGYEYSVWVDGNIEITKDVSLLIDEYLDDHNKEILAFKHPIRNCVYEEAEACIRLKKDKETIIREQVDKYQTEGYPDNNGMIESNVIIRKHNSERLIRVMEDWWIEISNHSRRDQLSFNYVFWKNKLTYDTLPGNARGNNDYFLLRKHKRTYKDIIKFIKHRIAQVLRIV